VLRRDYCEAHPERAAAAHSQGKLALLRGDIPAALTSFEAAREDLAGVVSVDNPVYLQLTASAAIAYMRQGELVRATALIRDVLDAVERSRSGARSARQIGPELYTLRFTLASLLAKQGQLQEAEAEARSVLADAQRAWGPDEPHVCTAAATLADVLLAARRPAEALPLAEHAYKLALSGKDQVHPRLRYTSAFALARVLAAQSDLPRAITLASEARALAHKIGDTHTVAELDAWLANNPAS
jgi:tetratricopeptide (TPR) repeat protein